MIRELPLHLLNLAGAGVVPQCPCHLLVGHGLAISLSPAPQLRQELLVLGGELKGASGGVNPPDAAPHRRCLKHLKQELEQSFLPLSYQGGRGCECQFDVTDFYMYTCVREHACEHFFYNSGLYAKYVEDL